MKQTRVDGSTEFLNRLDPSGVHDQLVDDRFVRASLARTSALGTAPASTRTEQVDP
ncbi:MAG: hypothetical protein IPM90_11370 [Austwickia sp.]|nr:hypothetical protein [Austwickia sp.]